MKRVFGLVLTLVLLVSLCACGNGGETHTHAFGVWTTVIESTCAVAGSQERVCACGEKETQALATKVHTPGDWVVDTQATASQDGHRYQPCAVCGAKLKEEAVVFGSQGLAYTFNSGACTILGIGTCTDTKVVIPSKIDGHIVSQIVYTAFEGCRNLTSIVIPDGVIRIEGATFRDCSSLTSVEIPDSVTSIDAYAFARCVGLTGIKIPDSVTCIEGFAFSGCSSLESIEIPDGVTDIRWSIFEGCIGLTDIEIPERVTRIGQYAFSGCSSLTRIKIPASVTNIEDSTFEGCHSLTRIDFGGTKAQWNAISKAYSWDTNTGNYTVYCTDGTVSK